MRLGRGNQKRVVCARSKRWNMDRGVDLVVRDGADASTSV
jgi:hypothetical protein